MRRLIALAVLVGCAVAAPVAWSCSCAPPPPPKGALENAVAVFSGKCVEMKEANQFTKQFTFEVAKVWKGEVGKKVTVTTAANGAACGYGFDTKGEATYIVYCFGKGDALQTNLCTRTRPLSAAAEDLKELGDGAPPKEPKKN